MRHRHLDIGDGTYSVASIHSIMERGGASDIKDMLRTIQQDPFSEVADMALRAAEASDVYGYPALIIECVREWRGAYAAKPAAGRLGRAS